MEEDRDIMNGYPWPPRSYTCTFCKREFKSAQALGGHMNVHRKDRARLRCPPPTDCLSQLTHSTLLNLNLNPKPNPNPNLISSPPPPPSATPLSSVSARQLPPLTTSSTPVPSWISPPSHSPFPLFSSPSATCHGENMKWVVGGTFLGPCFNLKTLDLCTQMKIKTKSQEDGCMRLDLENGVLRGDSEEDIDLELRLGKYN